MPISRRPNRKFFNLADYHPFPIQEAIHKSKADMRVVCVGRQVGKSEAAAIEAAFELVANPGAVGWVVAPTYDQAEIVWGRTVEKLEKIAEKLTHIEIRLQRRRLRIQVVHWPMDKDIAKSRGLKPVATSEFRGKSGDRLDNLRGATLDFAILDEAAMMMPNVWSEAIQPMLSTRKGWALFISTPKGWNWFYKAFRKGWRGKSVPDGYEDRFGTLGVTTPVETPESERSEEYESFHSASWEVREDVGVAWYERSRRGLPDLEFRQEYGAEFISHSGSVFTAMDLVNRVPYKEDKQGRWVVEKAKKGREYVIGADFGKNQDFSVFSVLDPETGAVVCMERTNDTSWSKQRAQLKRLARDYNDALIIPDAWGIGQVLVQDLYEDGLRVEPFEMKSAAIKEELINHFSLLMQNSEVTLPDHETIFEELRGFQYHTSPSGKTVMKAYGRGHDDIVISLALAYSQYDGGGVFMFERTEFDELEDGSVAAEAFTDWDEDSVYSELEEANRMFRGDSMGVTTYVRV